MMVWPAPIPAWFGSQTVSFQARTWQEHSADTTTACQFGQLTRVVDCEPACAPRAFYVDDDSMTWFQVLDRARPLRRLCNRVKQPNLGHHLGCPGKRANRERAPL